MEARDVVLILGSTPEKGVQPLEVYLDKNGADMYILNGLLQAFAQHVGALEPGGTLSLIVNRGVDPDEDTPRPSSSGSFVINNPKGDRHVWDFNTIFCEATPHG